MRAIFLRRLSGTFARAVDGFAAGVGRNGSVTPAVPEAAPGAPPVGAAALAIIDLGGLAQLNATEGFDVGDRLLDAAGDVLRRALVPGAELERMQGGRFLVWLPAGMVREACAEAERLRAFAAQAIVVGRAGPISCEVSSGIASIQPGEAWTRALLRADLALSGAKALGGGRTEVALTILPAPAIPPRAEIEAAIAARALEYHVQPIVALDGGRPAGVEALIRWSRPDGGTVGPAGFLSALNRIPEAGSDLLPEMAFEAARRFADAADPLYVSFNVSGAVLDGTSAAGDRWLTELVERVPANRLVLEIVETAVIVDQAGASARIDRLRARGVRIALDDFGTGLSCFDRLRRFPVDIVKVDRAFVTDVDRDPRAEAIVGSLVRLAETLGFDLIAEGVETEAQEACLRKLGVSYGQGYRFGRPAAAADWAARLAAANR